MQDGDTETTTEGSLDLRASFGIPSHEETFGSSGKLDGRYCGDLGQGIRDIPEIRGAGRLPLGRERGEPDREREPGRPDNPGDGV